MDVNEGEIVEVVLGPTDDQTSRAEQDDHTIVETTARPLRRLLGLVGLGVLLVVVGFVVVPMLGSDDDQSAPIPEEAAPPSSQDRELFDEPAPPQTGDLPGPTAAVGDTSSIGGSTASSNAGSDRGAATPFTDEGGPIFPLMPESPGYSLAIVTNDGLVVLDADDGSRQTFDFEDAGGRPDEYFDSGLASNPSVRFGDSVVSILGANVVGSSLVGGPMVDYGEAVNFWVTNDGSELQLARTVSGSGDFYEDPLEIVRFGLDSRPIGEPIAIPLSLSFVYPVGNGLFSVWGEGIFGFVGDGFERVGDTMAIAVGPNHLLVQECSDRLVCIARLLDSRTGELGGEADFGDLNLLQTSGSLSISPTGKHLGGRFFPGSQDNDGYAVIEVATGDRWDLPVSVARSYDERGGVTWSPDGRYLLSLTTSRIDVFDLERQTYVGYSNNELGLQGVSSAADVVLLE